ncbi:Hypothetical predicted protein [Cloeon dipterum]|uniref:Uncharacterized protein n=1 Tax=Cloeon dipterum TaxID=197152 RepID=A0A8S1DP44_9INSE|nr:Hypothetical predicted protein [Cloeon dipterum]
MCIEHLPKLEVVHNFANCAPYCDEYCLPSVTRISGLQHLRIQLRNLQPELLQWFPNVTHLKIDLQSSQTIDEAVMTALLQFKKIKSLVLSGCGSAAILDRVLDQFGHQLHTLAIESILDQTGNSFRFETINKSCPNLETLILRNVNMIDSDRVKNFAKLKNFQWIKPETGSIDFCLSNVLLAPKLECLEMLNAEMNLDDLKNASTLITERKILKNAKIFRLLPTFEIRSCSRSSRSFEIPPWTTWTMWDFCV